MVLSSRNDKRGTMMARKYHPHQVTEKGSTYSHRIAVTHRSQHGRDEHDKELAQYKEDMGLYYKAQNKIKEFGGWIKKRWSKFTLGGVSIATLLTILLMLPGAKITTSGDIYCMYDCVSYINYTNDRYSITVNNISDFGMDIYFDQEIRGYEIYLKVDNEWTQDIDFLYKPKGEVWEFKLVGHKEEEQTVKWGIKIGKINVDPLWSSYTGAFEVKHNPKNISISGSDFFGEYSVNLIPFIEFTNGTVSELNFNDKSIYFDKIDSKKFKYGIYYEKLTKNTKYVGFYFNCSKRLVRELNNHLPQEEKFIEKISFCGEDSCMDFNFADVEYDYVLNEKMIKIDVSGLMEIDIDPTVEFTTQQVESLDMAPIANNKIAIAWCDEVGNDITYRIDYTNGTNIKGVTDIDSTGSSCGGDMVSVAPLNSTHFIVAYDDIGDRDASFVIMDIDGNIVVGPIDVDTDVDYAAVGRYSYSVSVRALNSSDFVVAWVDNGELNRGIEFAIYNFSGTKVVGPFNISTYTPINGDGLDIAVFNETHYVIGWHNYSSEDIYFNVYNNHGTKIVGPITVDDATGGYGRKISMEAYNSTNFVITWSGGYVLAMTAKFAMYDWQGNNVVSAVTMDSDIGQYSYGLSTAIFDDGVHFVSVWTDIDDGVGEYVIFNTSGEIISGPTSTGNATDYSSAVAADYFIPSQGLCQDTFVHAYAVNTTKSEYITLYLNGSLWDGECPSVGAADVNYSLNAPFIWFNNTAYCNSWSNQTVEPWLQTAGLGIFNVTNNGTITGAIQAKVNATATNYTMILGNGTANFTLTTDYQTVSPVVTQGTIVNYWLYLQCWYIEDSYRAGVFFQAV